MEYELTCQFLASVWKTEHEFIIILVYNLSTVICIIEFYFPLNDKAHY